MDEAIDVLLPLGNIDAGRMAVDRLAERNQFGKPIKDAADAFEAPHPAADAVWPPLEKALWVIANDLVEQFAGLVAVIVRRNDLLLIVAKLDPKLALQPFRDLLFAERSLDLQQLPSVSTFPGLKVLPEPALVPCDSHVQRAVLPEA